MCTEATFEIGMLSSFDPNSRAFVRITRCGLMTSLVGKKKFPRVHREALKVSAGDESIVLIAAPAMNSISTRASLGDEPGFNYPITQLPNYKMSYTHSSAPFFHTQMYPTIRITRKINISISPNSPNALNFTAQGKRKMVSTSNTTNRIAMM